VKLGNSGDSFYKKGDKKENKYGKPPPSKVDIKNLFGF
jgi:hypothetical protein